MAGSAKKKPTSCTSALFARVLDRIAAGESLSSICRKDWAPKRCTFLKFKNKEDDRRNRYTRARVEGIEAKVDKLHDIPDLEEDWGRARLKCDNIKWEASKIAHHIYGDKITQEHTGKDGTPISVNFVTRIPEPGDE